MIRTKRQVGSDIGDGEEFARIIPPIRVRLQSLVLCHF